MELGDLLRELRCERGMTQTDIAIAVGRTHPTISRIESGRGGRGGLKTDILRGIVGALEQRAPLTEEQRARILVFTGLS